MTGIIALMMFVSILLGVCALFGLLWGIKTKQFEDYSKFLDGTKFDSEDALNDAYKMEQKKKEALKNRKNDKDLEKDKGYRPPD
ncbi:cbb3-type cytochrome oxidase assembly protein [Campylobacter ureolyticus]|uniref:Cytochrome oxidase maturation protein, cbb3-type n=2 Tax=Campylobacter ureolyticus TaxID=827 RepID=S3XM52_9BACT|nr:cbb3-type cytochrome oxidase assembly protein [Campylobacter ureolyticus]EPH10507.1 cytochrome oxidase maturation protein, cbb3-type [Campylobacter ureolyticus ACS-301-V-Sch3b]MCR8684956.1 cbb3-type cytochrome oxidase assembly protein [Campylobacter ureolyticus]QKF83690.1 cytochrome oxidase maturation protein, cbb3-type [Campylobacter ureolyticus]QQY36154.1 cbb3-type cytochrome oxidase assembly protein [Campylobacter ureolyticus]SUX24996.1 Type cbb3 cytochrome oxidase biogenesis protein Cco